MWECLSGWDKEGTEAELQRAQHEDPGGPHPGGEMGSWPLGSCWAPVVYRFLTVKWWDFPVQLKSCIMNGIDLSHFFIYTPREHLCDPEPGAIPRLDCNIIGQDRQELCWWEQWFSAFRVQGWISRINTAGTSYGKLHSCMLYSILGLFGCMRTVCSPDQTSHILLGVPVNVALTDYSHQVYPTTIAQYNLLSSEFCLTHIPIQFCISQAYLGACLKRAFSILVENWQTGKKSGP